MGKNKENKKENSEEKKNSKLKEEIKKLKEELEETKSNYLRTLADFENYRKRTQEEMNKARDFAIISFVENLLPAIDNFELSLKMTDNTKMFIKGVEMIHKNLIETLKEHHIEEFEPQIGDEFNPNMHDPMPIEDKSKESGKVLSVLKKGYKHKDKVIRPAKVEVRVEK